MAPDHPEVKNVINTFTKTAEHPNVRYFGNVTLGQDISMQDLKKAYHIVLLVNKYFILFSYSTVSCFFLFADIRRRTKSKSKYTR